ncbi:hypothetical protein [Nocardioides ferulae]|uniref:hypothetical protein n=1 Tax=Nocardioides ferulae TaxID=2340821 RepID=UPI000F881745|nr:hypothetical protein [Nocardioides ferulae]
MRRDAHRPSPAISADLLRIALVVWPDGAGGHRLTTAATPGTLEDGVESYLVLPHLRSPRFLLPLDATPQARSRLLLRYNRLRSDRRRATRSALAGLVRFGLPRPRPGVNLVRAAGSPSSLLADVAAALGAAPGSLVLSTGVRPGTGTPRPTLNVADREGRPRAFVKVALDPGQQATLAWEHDLAADFAREPVPGLLVPRPLFRLTSGNALVVGVEALPIDIRRVRVGDRERVQPWLDRLVASRPRAALRLDDSPWTARLADDAAALPEPWRGPTTAAVARLRRDHGTRVVEHGLRHGDWSPWNMGRVGADRLAVWDWEFSEPLAPLGLDEWNWGFAHDTSVRGRTMPEAAAGLRAAAAGRPTTALTAELLLVDMAVRRAAEAAAGAAASAAYARDLLDLLSCR